MIYDLYGNPLLPPKRGDLDDEVAAPSIGSVRQVQSGHPADGLTPARLAMILREAELGDATNYLEMAEQFEEKDLHYAGVLGVRKRAIRALTLQITAGGDNDVDEDAAQLVRDALSSAAIKSDLVDMLDAIGKGYSVTEIKWNTKTKPWKVVGFKHRDPRWFKYDPLDGETLLLRDNAGDIPMRPYRFILHEARAKSGLPIRGGLARLAAWAYIFKNYSLKDWSIFMEAFGHPIRLGRYSTNATPKDRATLLKAVRQMGTDMAAIIPKEMEIEIINGNVTGAAGFFEASARYWDEQISKAVLGQVSTTDAIAGGHAVGKVHADVRDDIRDADAEQLAATLQRDLAGPITFLNYGGSAAVPKISFITEEEHDPRLLVTAAKTFGPVGLKIPLAVVQERFNIRPPEDGEEVLDFSQPKKTGDDTKNEPGKEDVHTASSQSNPSEFTRFLDEIMESSGRDVVDPVLGEMMEALEGARSLDDIRDILGQLVDSEPDEGFREFVMNLMFNARIAGEINAELEHG